MNELNDIVNNIILRQTAELLRIIIYDAHGDFDFSHSVYQGYPFDEALIRLS